ncbi:MAG: hypothetical protein AAGF67_00830 [Verrucomicrobiota bacterium]
MAPEADPLESSLEELDEAWEKKRENLQTKGRWYTRRDPTAKDAAFLIVAGVFFIFVGGVYLWASLTLRDEQSKLNPLYTFLFLGVSVAYFVLASDVRQRLRKFQTAKAEYQDQREKLETGRED